MPVLENPRHEKFVQELAKGAAVSCASETSGYYLKSCHGLVACYVYLLVDPRDDIVFYVGKGTGKRAFNHVAEWRSGNIVNAAKHQRIADIHRAKARVVHKCFVDGMSSDEALTTERWLIRKIGIKNLTNLMHGEQTASQKLSVFVRDELARVRPYCRWKERILPQFNSPNDISHEALEHIYWDTTGQLSEILAKLEGRPYREFPAMWQPNIPLPRTS